MGGPPTIEEVVGTVINGTLLPADLIQAFLEQLEVMNGQRAGEIRKEYAHVFTQLPELAKMSCPVDDKEAQHLCIDAGECFEDLIDALNACAPEGLFFGSHPGDGSDFGFWPVESHDSEEAHKQERQRDASEKNRDFALRWGTGSGSIACKGPNLQNIPVRSTPIGRDVQQSLFGKRPMSTVDYTGVEARMLMSAAHDPKVKEAIMAHLPTAEEPAEKCGKCGGRALTEQQHVELNQVMDADQKFDAGEWSGAHDYYKGICRCDEEGE